MSGLSEENVKCSLCGAIGKCFDLSFSICSELTDSQKESAVGCESCLSEGRFEFWHDTEIGVLDETGLHHVYKHNKEPPVTFQMNSLSELRRTPQFITWQQELWLTHCDDFMAYVGTWKPKDFYEQSATGDGRALFMEMTEEYNHLWDSSMPEEASRLDDWHATYYVFKCLHCGKLRGNWDCD